MKGIFMIMKNILISLFCSSLNNSIQYRDLPAVLRLLCSEWFQSITILKRLNIYTLRWRTLHTKVHHITDLLRRRLKRKVYVCLVQSQNIFKFFEKLSQRNECQTVLSKRNFLEGVYTK